MILFNIKQLLRKKAFNNKTKYTYKDIEKATGIKSLQLTRLNTVPNYNTSITHIEKLCRYFNCTPSELIKIYDDPPNFNLSEFNPLMNQ